MFFQRILHTEKTLHCKHIANTKRKHYIARLNSFNPGLTNPGLKTFEQYKFNPGLVNPSFKPGLGLNQD